LRNFWVDDRFVRGGVKDLLCPTTQRSSNILIELALPLRRLVHLLPYSVVASRLPSGHPKCASKYYYLHTEGIIDLRQQSPDLGATALERRTRTIVTHSSFRQPSDKASVLVGQLKRSIADLESVSIYLSLLFSPFLCHLSHTHILLRISCRVCLSTLTWHWGGSPVGYLSPPLASYPDSHGSSIQPGCGTHSEAS
jgi:hypothetical protein